MQESAENKKRERTNPYGEVIPGDWSEQRVLGERIKDLQKFVMLLKKTYGDEGFTTWVSTIW